MRYEDEECLVFDDLLSLTPCHLNAVPSSAYIPDWRYLLRRPESGLALIEGLLARCLQILEQQFCADSAWCTKILHPAAAAAAGAGDASIGAAELTKKLIREQHLAVGFNYPPSQYQLHLQFMLPPFLPFQYALYLQGVHFTAGRFFPIEYVRAVLKLGEALPEPEAMSIEEIIWHFKARGVDYEEIHSQCYARYGDSHRALAKWHPQDFTELGLVGGDAPERIFRFGGKPDTDLIPSNEDPKAMQAADKLALQNYGRPYDVNGKPQGCYYSYAKSSPSTFPDFHSTSS